MPSVFFLVEFPFLMVSVKTQGWYLKASNVLFWPKLIFKIVLTLGARTHTICNTLGVDIKIECDEKCWRILIKNQNYEKLMNKKRRFFSKIE